MSSARIIRLGLLDPCRFQREHHYDVENVNNIANDLREGSRAIHNPIHVIPKGGGRWEIVAGHDRVRAARLAGFEDVPARDLNDQLHTAEQIYEHWRRDNVLRKQPDREAAASETLVEWAGKWADRRVATVCGVSPTTVGKIRARLEAAGQLSTVDSREGSDGRTRKAGGHRSGTIKKANKTGGGETQDRLARREDGDNPEVGTAPVPPAAPPTPVRPSATPTPPSGVAQAPEEVTGGQKVSEAEQETPEPEVSSSTGEASLIQPGEGEPSGVVVPNPSETPSGLDSGSDVQASLGNGAVGVGGAESEPVRLDADLEEAVWSAVADLPSRVLVLKAEPRVLRSMARLLSDNDFAGIKDFHRALGTFLLQAEIARKQPETAGAAA